jgi:hypothetical protein
VSLTEILGYASASADEATKKEATRRLRAYLTSTDAAMYGSDGTYLGQGIRFNLGTLGLSQRCAERIWRVAASVDGKQTTSGYTTTILYKDRNFATHDCSTGGFRTGTTRAEVSMLVPSFGQAVARNTVKADLTGQMGVTRTQLRERILNGDYPGSSNELRLMGPYGEYVLLFPKESLVELQLGEINDVLFRFDLLAAGDGQEPTN